MDVGFEKSGAVSKSRSDVYWKRSLTPSILPILKGKGSQQNLIVDRMGHGREKTTH